MQDLAFNISANDKSQVAFDLIEKQLDSIMGAVKGLNAAAKAMAQAFGSVPPSALPKARKDAEDAGEAFRLSAFQMQNLSFQLNDIAMGLATGQSPFRVMIQQGSQIAQIFGPGVGVGAALKSVGAGILAFLANPINLTVVAIGAATAIAGKLFDMIGSGEDKTQTLLKEHADLVSKIKENYGKAGDAASAFGEAERSMLQFRDLENQQEIALKLAQTLRQLGTAGTTSSFWGILQQSPLGGIYDTARDIGDAIKRWGVSPELSRQWDDFQMGMRSGKGDVLSLEKELSELALKYPTKENIAFVASIEDFLAPAAAMQKALGEDAAKLEKLKDAAAVAANALTGVSFDWAGSFTSRSPDTKAEDAFQRRIEQIEKETADLKSQASTYGMAEGVVAKYRAEQDLLLAARQKGLAITPALMAEIDGEAQAYGDATDALDNLKKSSQELIDKLDGIRDTGKDALATFISDLRGGKGVVDSFTDALGRIEDKLLDMGENSVIQSLFGKSGSSGGGALSGLLSLFGVGGSANTSLGAFTGGTAGAIYHGGTAFVGAGAASRGFPSGIFAGAPRLHSGLMADEFPAILQRGEKVIPRGKSAGGGNVSVQVIDQRSGGAPVGVERTKGADGLERIRVLIQDEVARGKTRQVLGRVYGVTPVTTRRGG